MTSPAISRPAMECRKRGCTPFNSIGLDSVSTFIAVVSRVIPMGDACSVCIKHLNNTLCVMGLSGATDGAYTAVILGIVG
jgi:hypothetical protein